MRSPSPGGCYSEEVAPNVWEDFVNIFVAGKSFQEGNGQDAMTIRYTEYPPP